MQSPFVLFRRGFGEDSEEDIVKQYFPVIYQRSHIPSDALIIGRYSVLPYYTEVEADVQYAQSRLINSYAQHRWIADFDYYHHLAEYTFETWTEYEYPTCGYNGPVVIKGRTNSRKHQWNELMFANNRAEAIAIAIKLRTYDDLLASQGLIFRRYEPLRTYHIDEINAIRYTHEFRVFFYKNIPLAHGYYWTQYECPTLPMLSDAGMAFAQRIANTAQEFVNFYTVDIAQKDNGDWVLIELNDGQMAGLSYIDPHDLYRSLATALNI